jgi:chemotaxis signal transduction protein
VLPTSSDAIEPPPPQISADASAPLFLNGIARLGDQLVMLIELDTLSGPANRVGTTLAA